MNIRGNLPSRRTLSFIMVPALLILAQVVPGPALAHHAIEVAITQPTGSVTADRVTAINFAATATGHSNQQGTCTVTSVLWSFGDGTTSSSSSATKTYSSLGTFTATFQAFGTKSSGGSCTSPIASRTITIQNLAPSVQLAVPVGGVAGQTLTFSASGSDVDGTIASYRFTVDGDVVETASASIERVLAAGEHTVSVVAIDNNGGMSAPASTVVEVGLGTLTSIGIAGPASVVVGSTTEYALSGVNEHGAAYPLEQDTLTLEAPTSPTTVTLTYAEGDVEATLDVEVVVDALHAIVIDGPETLVAGASAEYALAGEDRFGNPVALAQETLSYTAPTTAGAAVVSYEEGGVTGTLDIEVVPDVLAVITLEGPATLVAGQTGVYAVSGVDRYENPVALAVESVEFVAPTAAGPYAVTYAEGDAEGSLDVTVVADALATIEILGPDSVLAGSTTEFGLAGFDQYRNPVALAAETVEFVATYQVGAAVVSYEEGGITAAKDIQVLPVPLQLVLSVTAKDAVSAFNEGVSGTLSVAFPDGSIAAGADVRVIVLRNVPLLGNVASETFVGQADESGGFSFTTSEVFSLPGDYMVLAFAKALGNEGNAGARYTIR